MFKEKFAWRELAPAVIAFATALLLIWQGMPKEPLLSAAYSLSIALAFTVADVFVEYFWAGNKMKWRLRQD
jgi:drug/metabolite transporter (DMT)-like permease